MSKLDKSLEKILDRVIDYIYETDRGHQEYNNGELHTTEAISQIKSTILKEIEKEMPKEINNTKDIRAIWDDEDFAVDWRLGYNQALQDTLTTLEHLLGDGE